ncbi:transposase [Rhizobium leguminosarum]|uniref:transposase n=1 Tax=Rhizobium leguminosarum TaxID=384 RepID=UPI0032AF65D7
MRRRRKPRDWSDGEKARIVAATLQPGANVSAVARSEGFGSLAALWVASQGTGIGSCCASDGGNRQADCGFRREAGHHSNQNPASFRH